MKKILCLAVIALSFAACKKNAGDGGNSSLNGIIKKDVRVVLTNPNTRTGTFPAADQDVFIIYGDHSSPDDKVQTNYDGEFEFLYLRPGKYKVYTYSEDTNAVAVTWDEKHMTILREVEITDKKQEVTVDDMTIYEQQ